MTTSQHFLDRLGLQLPIIQAPMAGVSTPRLAAAVSNAGGLGSLGIGAGTVAQARQMIMDTRALTDKPFQYQCVLPCAGGQGCAARSGLAGASGAPVCGAGRAPANAAR